MYTVLSNLQAAVYEYMIVRDSGLGIDVRLSVQRQSGFMTTLTSGSRSMSLGDFPLKIFGNEGWRSARAISANPGEGETGSGLKRNV